MTTNDGSIGRPWWSFGCAGAMTARDVRNLGRFNLLMLAWALVWCASLLTLGSDWIASQPLRAAIALVPFALLLVAMVAYLRFLRHADELLRRIHVEGLGVGFVVGLVLATGWRLLERAGAAPIDPAIIGSLMLVGWAAGQALARRRYL